MNVFDKLEEQSAECPAIIKCSKCGSDSKKNCYIFSSPRHTMNYICINADCKHQDNVEFGPVIDAAALRGASEALETHVDGDTVIIGDADSVAAMKDALEAMKTARCSVDEDGSLWCTASMFLPPGVIPPMADGEDQQIIFQYHFPE